MIASGLQAPRCQEFLKRNVVGGCVAAKLGFCPGLGDVNQLSNVHWSC